MTRYEIEQELDKLYRELNDAGKCDEETVCRIYNADSKNEIMKLISSEIDLYEDLLKAKDEEQYDLWDDHGFANEADYVNWRYGA